MRKIQAILAAALAVPVAFAADPATEALDGALVIKSQEAVAYVPVAAETARVAWAAGPIRVDGDLTDWNAQTAAAIALSGSNHVTWSGGTYGGVHDLALTLRLCRDDRFLYVALEMADDRLPAPDRVEMGFADAASPLITTWRDVGMRYGADDVHAVFALAADGGVSMRWPHSQQRMESGVIANSFGNEAERRAFIEQQAEGTVPAKVFAACGRTVDGGRSVSRFEAAIPWKRLAPYVPVSCGPLKFNIVAHDADAGSGGGLAGWKPGLAGTYSAAHFPTLAFDPPAGRGPVEAYAQVPQYHYLNEKIAAAFAFHNNTTGSLQGRLELHDRAGSTGALAAAALVLPPGFSQTNLAVHSEAVGKTNAAFRGRLAVADGPVLEIPVFSPGLEDGVTIQPVAEVLAAIAGLETNVLALSNLVAQAEAKGLDMTYPRAIFALHQMFVARCRGDLKGGDSRRVLANTAYLAKRFPDHRNYLEAILRDPSRQFTMPPRVAPGDLVLKDGYYHAQGRPVFLWGPCTFWYMRADQHYAWELGFNSVGPEVPIHEEKQRAAIDAHLRAFQANGMLVNASIGSAVFDALKKEHSEVANVDRNNFLPVLVQHPLVREEIARRFQADIGFLKDFPGVRSYWLWNEPDYANFSELTRRDFITQYLRPRYKTVEALNARWRTALAGFDEVVLPRELDATNQAPWVDFSRFQQDLLADFFGFLDRTAKGIDPTRPTHTKYMCISAAFLDIERLQGLTDIAGHDGNNSDRDIVFLDLCKSVYPDKPLVNTEIHIWYKDWPTVAMVPWRLALHGLADGNWWCWHSNARFSNTVGSGESMDALAIAGLDVRRLFDPYLVALNRKPRPVATLYPDIVPRRSDAFLNRLRYEVAPAQYALGLQPFYATEARIAQGELAKRKVLVACEAEYAREETWRAIGDYVRGGGTLVVLSNGLARTDYGDTRDTSALIPPAGGEPFADGATVHALGRGRVVVIRQLDGAGPDAKPDARQRQAVYRRVLAQVLAEAGLADPVRLAPAASDPDALYGMDIRCAPVEGGYVLAALPAGRWEAPALELAADRPVRRIVNLITGRDVDPAAFRVELGPNLFRVELAPE